MSLKKFYCAVSKCNIENADLERRHFFKFPKEHDRWLQWVKACGRVDLEAKGPQYANQNCYLCNLHFEEKWYKTNNIRARLHPDAIPTKFCRSSLNQNDAVDMSSGMEKETLTATTIQEVKVTKKKAEQQNNEGIQEQEIQEQEAQQIETDTQQEKRNENTANKSSIQLTENSPRKRKLRMKIMKLKAQNKTLRETIRRMKRKKQTKIAPKKEEDEHETLRELGCSSIHDRDEVK